MEKVFTPETIPSSPESIISRANAFKSTFEAVEVQGLRKQQKKPKKVPKNIILEEDEDYDPNNPNTKKKSTMKQIENRNIIPNVIRLIISFIQKKDKSYTIVKKLINKWSCPQSYTLKRYYMYQSMVKGLLNSYVNEETLKFLVKVHQEYLDIFDAD